MGREGKRFEMEEVLDGWTTWETKIAVFFFKKKGKSL
jgi:hypothetical protein